MTEPVEKGGASENGAAQCKAAPLLLAVAATTIVGLLEWSRLACAGEFSEAGELARSLLATISVYAGSGVVFGCIALLFPRGRDARGLAAVAGGLALATVLDREFRPALFIAALSLAFAASWLVNWIASRFTVLAVPRVWWVPFALGLVGAVTLVALRHASALPAVLVISLAGGLSLLALSDLRSLRKPWPLGSAIAVISMCGGSVALVMPLQVAVSTEVSIERPSLLLVTIDTLRADRIGAYGAQTARTPIIDALAHRGTRFEFAFSQSAFTVPSHTSIMTGNLPTTHGVLRNAKSRSVELPILAALREEGYTTAAFPSSDMLGPWFYGDFEYAEPPSEFRFGIPRASFQLLLLNLLRSHVSWFSTPGYRPAPDTAAVVQCWFDANRGHPFFAWVHFFDPHLPYAPPPELVRTADGEVPVIPNWYWLSPEERRDMLESPGFPALMRAYYDAEIEWVDTALGHVIEAAKRAAPGGRLVVAVTADHGESMGEHGLWWSRDLYEPTIRVPLIIAPEEPPTVSLVKTPVRSIDLAPTLFELAGLNPPGAVDGSSLVPLMKGEGEEHPRTVLSYSLPEVDYGRPVASLRSGDWKLIQRDAGWQGRNHWDEAELELYNVASDPDEKSDLASERPELVEPMAELLKGWRERGGEREQLSSRQREMLRALGYLE